MKLNKQEKWLFVKAMLSTWVVFLTAIITQYVFIVDVVQLRLFAVPLTVMVIFGFSIAITMVLRERLRTANLAKSQFLSLVSHELRTPLTSILGFAEVLKIAKADPPSPGQLRNINQIIRAGNHLLDMINDILDLSRIDAAEISLHLKPCSLSQMISECVVLLSPMGEEQGITFEWIDREKSERTVFADPVRLKQVLLNLGSNAVKYNVKGGHVSVRCEEIAGEMLRLYVTDTGPGIPPEDMAELYQPYSRLGAEDSTISGTGVGLAISKRLIELMGGGMGAESAMGKGSTFWVDIKLTAEAEDTDAVVAPLSATQAKEEDESKPQFSATLLYAEDDPSILELVRVFLQDRPAIRFLEAKTGPEGLEMALRHKPDVMLVDINLPGMSGVEILKALKQENSTRHIPVIALSANAVSSVVQQNLREGFYRYLTKPIGVTELLSVIDDALGFEKTD